MKKKIFDKFLIRRGREYHHLDASVILKAIKETEIGSAELKSQYITKLGYSFSGGMSVSAVGEVINKLYLIENDIARKSAVEWFIEFLIKRKIKIFNFRDEHIDLFNELRTLDNRIDASDILALAVAIKENADVFMTYDKEMLKSEKLNDKEFRRKYGIKLNKPL